MTNTDIYKPSLSLLSQMGIQLVTFHPEAEVLNYLLYRTSLESGMVTSPLSYYTAAHPGFGLLRLKSGSLVYTTFSRESSITLSGNCLLLFDCQYPYRIRIKGSAEYDILHFSGFVQIYFQQYLASRKPFWLHTPAVGTACELLPLFDGNRIPFSPICCSQSCCQKWHWKIWRRKEISRPGWPTCVRNWRHGISTNIPWRNWSRNIRSINTKYAGNSGTTSSHLPCSTCTG